MGSPPPPLVPLAVVANLGLSFRDDPDEGVPLVACLTSLLLVCGDILLLAETRRKEKKDLFFRQIDVLNFKICISGITTSPAQKITFLDAQIAYFRH